ncbi:MAG: hypothetical protein ACREIQ_06175 [Nitrospiria bacterium]
MTFAEDYLDFDSDEAQAEADSGLPTLTPKLFNDVKIGEEFFIQNSLYRKLELQILPRYGWVNAVATGLNGITYPGDTGHRYFYAETEVRVI